MLVLARFVGESVQLGAGGPWMKVVAVHADRATVLFSHRRDREDLPLDRWVELVPRVRAKVTRIEARGRRGRARIGFDAPPEIRIMRTELLSETDA